MIVSTIPVPKSRVYASFLPLVKVIRLVVLPLLVGGLQRKWLPTHPYLIKYFILVLVRPIEESIYWLHRATAARRCINQLRMVR